MSNYGYNFYFSEGGDVLTFPITPPSLKISVGSNNETVTLINEGDINILKSPSLIEVEFEARFPMVKYPYSRNVSSFQTYFNKFKELKEEKLPFQFIVSRDSLRGKRSWDTNLTMALEEFEINEDADEGDDVLITFKLKQYKNYGVKTVKVKPKVTTAVKPKPKTTSTAKKTRTTTKKTSKSQSYTVKKGDCLWNIAKKYYGNGSQWKKIYNANKTVIENTAKKYRKGKGSSNGHWIYPGTKLTIPAK